ncbi:hypothetical protein WA026_009153 [Henosepilachna vigintioctopunctata]|uniref:Transmembrane protein 267 n=1 Tax=Henosepilachna vigintioctopunctata TaxID=420089 RepID=A0AAW1UVR5_9CUCU
MKYYEQFFIRRTHSICAVALLVAVSLLGDHLVSRNHEKHAFKAIVDNSTHFLIGGISWLIVCINTTFVLNHSGCLFQILLCGVIASIIDVDHFLSAKSLSLKDATNLKERPFLHCSTVPVVIFSCVFLFGNFMRSVTWRLNALVILVAFSSHHIRDATRRGLWFAPFGSTSLIPYPVYIALNCGIPYVISFILNCAHVRPTQDQYAYEV